MPDILDIPEVRKRVSKLSVEEYHRLDEFNENGRRTELIRGIVIEKMSKSPLHSSLAKRLYDLIAANLPSGYIVRREDPLTFKDSEPEPDIAVVRGSETDFFEEHPKSAELVIKVAVSSPVLDRQYASLYAESGVREFCILLAEQQEMEVYLDPADGTYRTVKTLSSSETFQSVSVPGISISLASLFR